MKCASHLLVLLCTGVFTATVSIAQEQNAFDPGKSNDVTTLKAEQDRLKKTLDTTRKDYELLIETLLKSSDESTILMGLRHLHKCQSFGWNPYSVAIHNELIKLTYSDNKQIREAAVLSVMRVAPSHAADHGFQGPGSPWRPVREDAAGERTRHTLDEEIAIQGSFTPKQLQEEFDNFGINVRFHRDIKPEPFEVDAQGVTVRTTLTQLLEPRGLNYWVEGETILVAPPTFKRSRPIHVYNVRGMLSDMLKLSRVIELAKDVVSDDNQPVTIEPVGEHKISVKGSEFQHYRISVFLGTIAPELKSEF